jgi:hypothetical protein
VEFFAGLGLGEVEIDPAESQGYQRYRVDHLWSPAFFITTATGRHWPPFDTLLIFDAPHGGQLMKSVPIVIPGKMKAVALGPGDSLTIRQSDEPF